MEIKLMLNMARSGGTLLNQCLGALDQVVMLSELNPRGGGWGIEGPASNTTVQTQAKAWYNLEIQSKGYVEGLKELAGICQQQEKQLLIRDWTHIDFYAHPGLNEGPSLKLENLLVLEQHFEVKPFAFIRHPIEVWTSRGRPAVAPFFANYLAYVKALASHNIQCFKYEDFCANPAASFKEICTFLELPYAPTFTHYQENERVNGDVRNPQKQPSRGRRTQGISVLPNRPIPEAFQKEINENQDLSTCLQIQNYHTYATCSTTHS